MPHPFRVNPSLVARYFFHDCERFLRFAATPSARQKAEGVPKHKPDTSPVMEAIREAGYSWEETVVGKHLKGKALIAPGAPGAPVRDRRFGRDETLVALGAAKSGQYVYQGSLRAPTRFYERFGIDPAVVYFSDNHPDLVAVRDVGGKRRFQIIDIKRSDTAKAVHRIQILLYAWELQEILVEEGIDGEVEVSQGGVWLGNADAAIDLALDPVATHVARFLRTDLPRVCNEAADKAAWHLHFRCEWCDYFDHCQQEMKATNNVSRLPGLTGFGKIFLTKKGVATVAELAIWLDKPTADVELERCASLAGHGHLLRGQAQAFAADAPVVHGASSMALPLGENVAVFLTAQEEPLEGTCYMAGALVQLREELRMEITGVAEAPKPAVWVAKSPGELPDVASGVIKYLDGLFENVSTYNQSRQWGDQLSLQCYVHNEREHAVFGRMLIAALDDPSVAEAAMRLLLHFSGPDLANVENHPQEPVAYPLVVLLTAQAQLVALPVDTSNTLPESLSSLGSAFEYKRNPHVHFPLGHGLRPDGIHKVWDGKLDIAIVRGNGKQLLHATRALLTELRKKGAGQLAAWPPKFTMPGTNGIKSPLLARLAFFTRFESVIACLDVRASRAEAREVQRQGGSVIEVEAIDGENFRVVHGPPDVEESTMPNWLLVTDDADGRLAHLRFPDYYARNKGFYGKAAVSRALVGIKSVTTDLTGVATGLRVSWSQKFSGGLAVPGKRYLLLPRFTDWTTDKVVDWLTDVDATDPTALENLLQTPSATARPLAPKVEKRAAASAPALNLTPSQVEAFRALRNYNNAVVWGPPGTGKTHFIAAAVATLAAAHRAEGKPFRVLITAFTHAAIENVLRAVTKTLAQHFPAANIPVWKAGPWNGESKPKAISEKPKEFAPALGEQEQVIIGATVYTCIKADPGATFDLVVIDEASQVRLSEASIPLMLRRKTGRLLLAGDHQQLPPIVHGEWPPPVAGPAIHGSILAALRVEGDPSLGLQLHENWRMNATLTALSAEFIYGQKYKCATDSVAKHRLRWTAPEAVQPFPKYCLDPRYPLVIVVLDGVEAGKENVREAKLVARLARALRDGLVTSSGEAYADDRAFFHGAGKDGAGVFVVSPHHVQIAAIRKALAAKQLTNPFVDTVEKMQGQEAEAVLISYGVSDPEFAMREAAFIYGRHRLNVAITRAKAKAVLFLPRPLLDAPPGVLDVEEAVEGLAFMRQLYDLAATKGQKKVFNWPYPLSQQHPAGRRLRA
jgi:hypothetical protein